MNDTASTAEPHKVRRTYRMSRRRCVIRVEADDFSRLCHAAGRRNVSPLELLDRIVKTVLSGNLINAVLDDE